jgi:hypothetical protein
MTLHPFLPFSDGFASENTDVNKTRIPTANHRLGSLIIIIRLLLF